MIISCIFQTLNYFNKDLYGWNISLTWIGLLNWIPFFYLFIATKNLLRTSTQRLKASICLVSGTIPVLVAGLGQYYLNWEGPFSFLNGTIIWYLKPIEPHLGLSSIFSNQNYAGTWLSTIWPFSLSFIFLNKRFKYKQTFAIFLLIISTLSVILTTSRNALIGTLFSLPIILGIKSVFFIIFIIITLISIFLLGKYIPFASQVIEFLISLFPIQFINKFNDINLLNIFEFRRINLWSNTIKLIASRPIFGLGAAFFPILYKTYYDPVNYTEQHTHNIFLELASGYGFTVSIITLIFIFYLIFSTFSYIKTNQEMSFSDQIINKSWLASTFILVLSQMNDVTYYDGRISIIFWILLSGSRNIIIL
tara:strand:+ start:3 stop:1094 length:1092 start_codon:yes stop_codon:yes gene_type:complete